MDHGLFRGLGKTVYFLQITYWGFAKYTVSLSFSGRTCNQYSNITNIRDFSALLYVILRRKFSKWLELCIESDLGMLLAIWSLDLATRDFAFFKQCFY